MLLLHTIQSALIYPSCTVLGRAVDKDLCATTKEAKVTHPIYDHYKLPVWSIHTIHIYIYIYPTLKSELPRLPDKQ